MMRSDSSMFLGAMAVFIVLLFFGGTESEDKRAKVSGEEEQMMEVSTSRLPQIIKSVRLDKKYMLAGEEFPMDNFDALERLDRELLVNSYWHSSTLLNIKTSKRYFPVMETILAEEGVPDDFKYVAVIESNLRNETSPAGAKGLWQFMSVSAKGYGLEISNEVDERYHIEKSTRAACQLIKRYKNRFGSWTNAFGAYNMGETRFAKEQANQKMDSYFDMNFGLETGRYLFRILALKEIMENPTDFGFYIDDQDPLYRPLDDCHILTVDSTIEDLGTYAIEHGTSYRLLKVYNPWLISGRLTVRTGKTYDIKVPKIK
ncbi:MAG: lytic transglycosylase domain-containing protein [Saprospiraceae bacterium]|nr:lytic transglycosylase domain-containing protein [Saprospiraceae bacterium]